MSNKPTDINDASSTEMSLVLAYYEHQYDRMSKQEEQRHSITNIIVTLSIVAYTFGFDETKGLSIMTGLFLPIVIISANIAALAYMERSRSWIHTHRARAKRVLEIYAPYLHKLDKTTPSTYKRYKLGRGRIQKILHLILIGASCIPIAIFVLQQWK